jgi:hypothetical protein
MFGLNNKQSRNDCINVYAQALSAGRQIVSGGASDTSGFFVAYPSMILADQVFIGDEIFIGSIILF